MIMGASLCFQRPLAALLLLVITSLSQNLDDCNARPSQQRPSCLVQGVRTRRYAVHSLPNVNFSLPASWVGQIPVPDAAIAQLFFWLFEVEGQETQCNNLISESFSSLHVSQMAYLH